MLISGKALGVRKPFFADWSTPLPPDWGDVDGERDGGRILRDLISSIVRSEVEAFRKRQHDRQFLHAMIADVSFQYDYGTAAEVEGLTMNQVSFRKRNDYRPLKLTDVPSLIFSEIMRDVDFGC